MLPKTLKGTFANCNLAVLAALKSGLKSSLISNKFRFFAQCLVYQSFLVHRSLGVGGSVGRVFAMPTPFIRSQSSLKLQKQRILFILYSLALTVTQAVSQTPTAATTQSQAYYFISSTLPKQLITEYLADAKRLNAPAVLRGIPPHTDLFSFLTQWLLPLIKQDPNAACIEIDPNLFERYGIHRVPALVIVQSNPPRYWKITGAVTQHFALATLAKAKAPIAPYERVANR